MRGGPESYEVMDTAGGLVTGPSNTKIFTTSDDALSGKDCVLSFNNDLATLAMRCKLATNNEFHKLELSRVEEPSISLCVGRLDKVSKTQFFILV